MFKTKVTYLSQLWVHSAAISENRLLAQLLRSLVVKHVDLHPTYLSVVILPWKSANTSPKHIKKKRLKCLYKIKLCRRDK